MNKGGELPDRWTGEMRCYDIRCQNCHYFSGHVLILKKALVLAQEHAVALGHHVDIEMRLKIHVDTINGEERTD